MIAARIVSTILLVLCACTNLNTSAQLPEIRGTYGNPRTFWQQGHKLDDFGINAIFVHSRSINGEMMQRASQEHVRVYAEFATLNGKNYVDEHPEAWPINEMGEREPAASWFMGVCPTEPGFREYRMQQLRSLVEEHAVAGVWMDYVHWHAQFEEPEPILPETCFCQSCLAAFQKTVGIQIPDGEISEKAAWILDQHGQAWRDWRCEVIIEWAKMCRQVIDEVRPGTLLGVYHCPWTDDEFDGARRRNLGLDLELLEPYIDVFSPMVYHGRMERSPQWVQEYVQWMCRRLDIGPESRVKIWPIVQARDDPEHGNMISAEEFETVLRYGVTGGSTGVMMFTFPSIAENQAKLDVLQRVYNEWKQAALK
jgi:hypothetical protein